MAWPSELRLNTARDVLTVAFDDGAAYALAAEYLRVESPSAEVRGHGPGQKQIITSAEDVKIDRLEPIGNYAVRIIFDDGHDTGLFSWDYLYKLGRERERIWGEYLKARAAL